mgnify:CR=1 FL=1
MGKIRNRLDKAANVVTKAVGAKDLADYLGTKRAIRKAKGGEKKYIKQTVTGKQAAKSGVRLAANIASLASGGAAAGTLRAASKARKAATIIKKAKIAKGIKEGSLVRIKGSKKLMRVKRVGANPSSTKNLKNDKRDFKTFQKEASRAKRRK